MWDLDYKEHWVPKNSCFWTVVLKKTLVSPLECKEIQRVHSKGNQTWIFIGRIDAEAETPILWLPDEKNWLIWRDSDAGNDRRQEEEGMSEDERLDGTTDLMAMSLTSSKSWWWTGKPGMLQSMGSERVGHYWVTKLNNLEVYHDSTRKLQQLNIFIRLQRMASSVSTSKPNFGCDSTFFFQWLQSNKNQHVGNWIYEISS